MRLKFLLDLVPVLIVKFTCNIYPSGNNWDEDIIVTNQVKYGQQPKHQDQSASNSFGKFADHPFHLGLNIKSNFFVERHEIKLKCRILHGVSQEGDK